MTGLVHTHGPTEGRGLDCPERLSVSLTEQRHRPAPPGVTADRTDHDPRRQKPDAGAETETVTTEESADA